MQLSIAAEPSPPIDRLRLWLPRERRVEAAVLIAGNRAPALRSALAQAAGATVETADEQAVGFQPLALRLPVLAGLELRLHMYPADTQSAEHEKAFWHHFQHTRWMLIASDGPSEDRSWRRLFEKLTRAIDAQRQDMRVALHGHESLRETWRMHGGPEPLVVSNAWTDVLEALTKDVLRCLKQAADG